MSTLNGSTWSYTYGGDTRKFRPYAYYTWNAAYSDNLAKLTMTSLGVEKTVGHAAEMASGTAKSCYATFNGSKSTWDKESKSFKYDYNSNGSDKISWESTDHSWTIAKGTTAKKITFSIGAKKNSGNWSGSGSGSVSLTVPAKTTTLTFNVNGGNAIAAKKATYGSNIILPLPTKSGDTFQYWEDSSGTQYSAGSAYMLKESATLKAIWHPPYVPPKVNDLRAYRVASEATGFRPDVSTSGTKVYMEFSYTEPLEATGFALAASLIKGSLSTLLELNVDQDEGIVYAYTAQNAVDVLETATIVVECSCIPYNATSPVTYDESTFISTESYIWDAFKNGGAQSFGIGRIAAEKNIPDNGRLDVAMDSHFEAPVEMLEDLNVIGAYKQNGVNLIDDTAEKSVRIGGILIQWGYVSVTPSAANKSTSKKVDFSVEFSSTPIVIAGIHGAPGVTTCIVGATNESATGFDATLYASNTTARGINWVALGKA